MKSKRAKNYIVDKYSTLAVLYGKKSPFISDDIEDMDIKLRDLKKAIEIAEQELSEHIPQWHDLRKNPKDLPRISKNVLVVRKCGYDYYYNVSFLDEYGYWIVGERHISGKEVVAWCKIPKFE